MFLIAVEGPYKRRLYWETWLGGYDFRLGEIAVNDRDFAEFRILVRRADQSALSVTGFIRQTFKDLLRLRLRKQCNAIVRLLAMHFGVISQFGNIIKRKVFIGDFALLDAYDIGVQTVNNGFELMQAHSNAVGVK